MDKQQHGLKQFVNYILFYPVPDLGFYILFFVAQLAIENFVLQSGFSK